MWCIPKVTPEFIERMEDVLALYEKPYDPNEPVLCFDEKSKQLLKDTRPVENTRQGKPRRRDYEYERNGTRNIFVTVEPNGGHREVIATIHRKRPDFAKEIQRIIELSRYRAAARIHIVLDNLNIHFEKSFRETFGAEETKRMMSRIQFHYTPKHASWLNMAEIEISILGRQCLNRRIPTEEQLIRNIVAWQKYRNQRHATISWRFTLQDAQRVFKEYYPTKLNE